jgi:hypothetical protein
MSEDKARSIKTLQDEIKKTADKIDDIIKDGGRVRLNDPLSIKLNSLHKKLDLKKRENENSSMIKLKVLSRLCTVAAHDRS